MNKQEATTTDKQSYEVMMCIEWNLADVIMFQCMSDSCYISIY